LILIININCGIFSVDVDKETYMYLCDAPIGASFRVVKVVLAREVGKRLADMGFTEGAEGVIVRAGFMRGPLQVQIRGYDILIRCCEAAGIEIQAVGLWPVASTGGWFLGQSSRNRFGAGAGEPISGHAGGGRGSRRGGSGHGKGRGKGPASELGRGA
jgi:ferrous iron transport protein A